MEKDEDNLDEIRLRHYKKFIIDCFDGNDELGGKFELGEQEEDIIPLIALEKCECPICCKNHQDDNLYVKLYKDYIELRCRKSTRSYNPSDGFGTKEDFKIFLQENNLTLKQQEQDKFSAKYIPQFFLAKDDEEIELENIQLKIFDCLSDEHAMFLKMWSLVVNFDKNNLEKLNSDIEAKLNFKPEDVFKSVHENCKFTKEEIKWAIDRFEDLPDVNNSSGIFEKIDKFCELKRYLIDSIISSRDEESLIRALRRTVLHVGKGKGCFIVREYADDNNKKHYKWTNLEEGEFYRTTGNYKFTIRVLSSKKETREKEENTEKKNKKCANPECDTTVKTPNTIFCSRCRVKKENKKTKLREDCITYKLSDYIKKNIKRLERRGVECRPIPWNTHPNPDAEVVNLYIGPKAISEENKKSAETLQKLIKEVLANGDEAVFLYVWRFFAFIVQFPHLKIPVAPIFIGLQGIGKSYIFNYFIEYILGRHICLVTNDLDQIFQRFNVHFDGQIFVLTEEGNTASIREKDHDKFKHTISDLDFLLERKGYDVVKSKNYAKFVILTNREKHRLVGKKERRFPVFECSPIQRDRDYFKPYDNLLKNEAGANGVMYALIHEDLSNFNPENWPRTPFYLRLCQINESSAIKFVDETNFGCEGPNEKWVDWGLTKRSKRGYVILDDLYSLYTEWVKYKNSQALVKFDEFEREFSGYKPIQEIKNGRIRLVEKERTYKVRKLPQWILKSSNRDKLPQIEEIPE